MSLFLFVCQTDKSDSKSVVSLIGKQFASRQGHSYQIIMSYICFGGNYWAENLFVKER